MNLLNGASLISTLMQICYATAIGYILVIIFYKSKSLVPCIITHAAFNALSIFSEGNRLLSYIITVFIIVVSLSYAFYINRNIEE